ncbi:MAG: protein kinase [Acidobacteria bacterium]|nr:protein kinase [Acidobacteriota bacterium]
MIGRRLGPYHIEAQLGAGGMGVVYRARDTRLERPVALKLIGERLVADETARQRLLREARNASALNHPHICTIYEVGEAEGQAYIAMEHVEGQPLGTSIPTQGLGVEAVLRYGAQIADALAHAHDRGIIHRDLKSSNVVIAPGGRAKVLDFGLAQRLRAEELAEATRSTASLADASGLAGTLAYMAPELLRAEPADARSDIWALGGLLYEMATGEMPFQGKTGFELTSAILREAPSPLPARVPAGLRAIIQRCLAKEPGQRYQRASEIRAALEALQSGEAVAAGPGVAAPRRRYALWALAVALLLIGGGIVAAVIRGVPFNIGITKIEKPSEPRLSTGGKPSANGEANEYFEKGLHFLIAQVDIPRATEMLERAIRLDPRFAEARAWYGYTYLLRVDAGLANDRALIYRAEEETRTALETDPSSGRALANLGIIAFYGGRTDQCKVELQKALQINPKDVDALAWLETCHQFSGEYEAAKEVLRRMMDLNPLYFASRWLLGEVRKDLGDTAGAIQEFEKVLEVDEHNVYAAVPLARAHVQQGNLAAARAALERVRPEDRNNFIVRLGRALLLAAEGKVERARKEMDSELQKYAEVAPYSTILAAEYYALMGEADKAVDWLDRAVQNGDERLEWFQRDPLLASIRNHPRFKQILDSIAFRRQQRRQAATGGG